MKKAGIIDLFNKDSSKKSEDPFFVTNLIYMDDLVTFIKLICTLLFIIVDDRKSYFHRTITGDPHRLLLHSFDKFGKQASRNSYRNTN